MKPFKSAEEFKAFLDTAQTEHKQQGLEGVSLPLLKRMRKCEHWTIRKICGIYRCVRCGQVFEPVEA